MSNRSNSGCPPSRPPSGGRRPCGPEQRSRPNPCRDNMMQIKSRDAIQTELPITFKGLSENPLILLRTVPLISLPTQSRNAIPASEELQTIQISSTINRITNIAPGIRSIEADTRQQNIEITLPARQPGDPLENDKNPSVAVVIHSNDQDHTLQFDFDDTNQNLRVSTGNEPLDLISGNKTMPIPANEVVNIDTINGTVAIDESEMRSDPFGTQQSRSSAYSSFETYESQEQKNCRAASFDQKRQAQSRAQANLRSQSMPIPQRRQSGGCGGNALRYPRQNVHGDDRDEPYHESQWTTESRYGDSPGTMSRFAPPFASSAVRHGVLDGTYVGDQSSTNARNLPNICGGASRMDGTFVADRSGTNARNLPNICAGASRMDGTFVADRSGTNARNLPNICAGASRMDGTFVADQSGTNARNLPNICDMADGQYDQQPCMDGTFVADQSGGTNARNLPNISGQYSQRIRTPNNTTFCPTVASSAINRSQMYGSRTRSLSPSMQSQSARNRTSTRQNETFAGDQCSGNARNLPVADTHNYSRGSRGGGTSMSTTRRVNASRGGSTYNGSTMSNIRERSHETDTESDPMRCPDYMSPRNRSVSTGNYSQRTNLTGRPTSQPIPIPGVRSPIKTPPQLRTPEYRPMPSAKPKCAPKKISRPPPPTYRDNYDPYGCQDYKHLKTKLGFLSVWFKLVMETTILRYFPKFQFIFRKIQALLP